MSEDLLMAEMKEEMKQLQSDEGDKFHTEKILKLYKVLLDFIATLPDSRKPKKGEALLENFYLNDHEFITKNLKISLTADKVTIYNLDTQKEAPDLQEEASTSLEKLVNEYCAKQKQELAAEQEKLMEEIRNF